MTQKALQDFLFGLFFGIGFAIAYNVLGLLAALIHSPALPH
jgi:hypothetical protein